MWKLRRTMKMPEVKVAKFINAAGSEEIIFTRNASESLNLVAYSYGLNNIKGR